MPTVSETRDEDMRRGKAQSVLEYYQLGMLGEETTICSLRILRYEREEIRQMMAEYPPRKR